jgi:hypothetical protein
MFIIDLISNKVNSFSFRFKSKFEFLFHIKGIIHKGDGTTINLKELQKTIEIAAGQLSLKRDIYCTTCSQSVKFYKPYSLSINKDGKFYY